MGNYRWGSCLRWTFLHRYVIPLLVPEAAKPLVTTDCESSDSNTMRLSSATCMPARV